MTDFSHSLSLQSTRDGAAACPVLWGSAFAATSFGPAWLGSSRSCGAILDAVLIDMRHKVETGFTLVELLVVIAIMLFSRHVAGSNQQRHR